MHCCAKLQVCWLQKTIIICISNYSTFISDYITSLPITYRFNSSTVANPSDKILNRNNPHLFATNYQLLRVVEQFPFPLVVYIPLIPMAHIFTWRLIRKFGINDREKLPRIVIGSSIELELQSSEELLMMMGEFPRNNLWQHQ